MRESDAADLDFEEARRRLGVNHRTLERWVRLGRLPAQHLLDGRVVFDRADVERLHQETMDALRRSRRP
jgi:predicted site-specific integrase-resolvase